MGIAFQIFSEVAPDPDTDTVNRALVMARNFEPDAIIALGGGSPMDAAKIVWLMYEHPEVKFDDLAMRFMDIRKRVCMFPELGSKAYMVAIPTTSGTGSEVTPFAVITDSATHIKYPIADYALSPNMAIIDPDLVLTMPKGLAAASGIDSLTHALEALASILATPFTDGIAYEAIRLILTIWHCQSTTAPIIRLPAKICIMPQPWPAWHLRRRSSVSATLWLTSSAAPTTFRMVLPMPF